VQLLFEAHEMVTGQRAEFGMSPTVTDAGWLGRAGIPTAIYGPGLLKHAHAIDEHVDLAEVVTCAKVLARVIATWCNQKR
jgi:acetylornithine deacetylase